MPITLNGNTGIVGPDGSASTPAIQGSDSNTGMFFPAADTIAFAEGGAEVARFDSSGNLGLGTTSPTGKLDVVGDSVFRGNQGFTTAAFVYSYAGGTNGQVRSGIQLDGTNQQMLFFTGSNERARIDSSGNWYMNSGYGSVATAYGCRAWVNFNGGSGAIRASGNVTSVTRNSTGDYTVNFTNAMPDANFSGFAFNMDGGTGYRNYFTIGNGYTTTTFRCVVVTPSSVFADPTTLGVAIFR